MAASLTGKKILLLDPEADQQKDLILILKDINYDVHTAISHNEGLATLPKLHPDLLLASVDDEIDIKELCARLRQAAHGQNFPLVIMGRAKAQEKKFKEIKGQKNGADAFIPKPSSLEDVVDQIERLIGLPSPPNGATLSQVSFIKSKNQTEERRAKELEKEIEALREQVHFYSQQLDQISVVGEKETHEIDQVLKELQDELEKARQETVETREEMQLLKNSLSEKDREIIERETEVGNVREDLKNAQSQLHADVDQLRKTLNETKDQHKKAQNALRNYYKTKMEKSEANDSVFKDLQQKNKTLKADQSETMEKLKSVEDQFAKYKTDYLKLQSDLKNIKVENQKMKDELDQERIKSKKAKDTLATLKKALE